MNLLEKATKGLNCCFRTETTETCEECPYYDRVLLELGHKCASMMRRDIERILQQLRPLPAGIMARPGGYSYFCPRCKNPVDYFSFGEFNSFCAFCGQAIDFANAEAIRPRLMTKDGIRNLVEGEVVWYEEHSESGDYLQPMMAGGNGYLVGNPLCVCVDALDMTRKRFWDSMPTKADREAVKWDD